MSNVIQVDFREEFLEIVFRAISQLGPAGAVSFLVEQGENESFAKIVVRKVTKRFVAR